METTQDLNSIGASVTLESVKNYYGKVLKTKHDLKTTACCSSECYPDHVRSVVSKIHDEVMERCYGCGIPIPVNVRRCTVLDMGCGAGRDAYILSSLVGPEGQVIGVDMTEEQLEVARRHRDYHAREFGYEASNVQFVKGYMEDLKTCGIKDDSVDLVISNCVFNLSPSKELLFSEIIRVLKPGGELYFSDVFSDRRLSSAQQSDPVLLGECLGGAIYEQDFRRLMRRLGVEDFREMSRSPISITNSEVSSKVGEAKFASVTIRAFKLPLEDQCEDYGQAAVYNGTIEGCESAFVLDNHHVFETGRLMTVCRNTASMLSDTRFGKHFTLFGNGSTHYGLFPCVPKDAPTPRACC